MEENKTIQHALREIQSKLKAPKGQMNNFGHYRYRSAEDILESVKPLLAENSCSLTISDDIIMVGNRIYVKATATLVNEDGKSVHTTAFARESENKSGMDMAQVTGAASSYARKYALNGLFCIDDTKDPDALNVNKEYTQQTDANLETIIANIKAASSIQELTQIWNECYAYQSDKKFSSALTNRKKELKTKTV